MLSPSTIAVLRVVVSAFWSCVDSRRSSEEEETENEVVSETVEAVLLACLVDCWLV